MARKQNRDFQRSKVYKWEDTFVALYETGWISIEHARIIVPYVWQHFGLKYPPEVIELPGQARREGDANAHRIRLQTRTKTWVVLHEAAHSLNRFMDNECDGHGPNYMGLYVQLLTEFMKIPFPLILFTTKKCKIEINLAAKPAAI